MRRWAVVVVLVGAVVGIACHDDQSVAYENATSITMTVMIDYSELVTLEPGESESFKTRENVMPDRVRAFDQDGTPRFDRTYTWEDLEQAGWRVIITDDPTVTRAAAPSEQLAVAAQLLPCAAGCGQ